MRLYSSTLSQPCEYLSDAQLAWVEHLRFVRYRDLCLLVASVREEPVRLCLVRRSADGVDKKKVARQQPAKPHEDKAQT